MELPEGVMMDELGRFWLCTDDGTPFAGPYDTPDEAENAVLAMVNDDDE
mgnify:CR=1 FL=1